MTGRGRGITRAGGTHPPTHPPPVVHTSPTSYIRLAGHVSLDKGAVRAERCNLLLVGLHVHHDHLPATRKQPLHGGKPKA
jgi:hypothetical protein